ncbi:MAG TPA: hypothetical protein VGR21_00320 [Cryptosporangiaceae bacterium]|nr:hypothetical protein [Cryptosporangiaceae bacterium]
MAESPLHSVRVGGEIDFDSLSPESIGALALKTDPFLATTALSELSSRDPRVEADIARTLLVNTPDPWLRSYAFSITLRNDPAGALGWFAAQIEDLDDAGLNMLLRDLLAYDSAWPQSAATAEVVEALERRLGRQEH